MAGGVVSTAQIFGLTVRESADDGSDFTNPAADYRRIFLGEDGQLHSKDSAGTVASLSGGGVNVENEGTPLSTTATTLDFVGAGVTATGSGSEKTITIPGYAPSVTNAATGFSSSATTVAVTTAAFAVGATIVAVVFSKTRTADSITQTNTTWTRRYNANGNGQYLTIWTGVVAGSPAGTTATVTLTGSGNQYAVVFQLPDVAALTSATLSGSATTAATTALANTESGTLTLGSLCIWGVAATDTGSAYSGANNPYDAVTAPFGGAGRMGIFYAQVSKFGAWSLSSTATSFYAATVVMA